MAQVTLNPGETYTHAGGTAIITGTRQGRETVIVTGGTVTLDPDFNAGGDHLVLSGAPWSYSLMRSGSSIILMGPNFTTVTIPSMTPGLSDDQNMLLTFSLGSEYFLGSARDGRFFISDGQWAQEITTVLRPIETYIRESAVLVPGLDDFIGSFGPDRFVSLQRDRDVVKAFNRDDRIDGRRGLDMLELNTTAFFPSIEDVDFTNTFSIERLVTNASRIELGAQAAKAGIVDVDARTRIDAANLPAPVLPGTLLDLTSDVNGDDTADFGNVASVRLASSVADTVLLRLDSVPDVNIDTGSIFTRFRETAAFGPIDQIEIASPAALQARLSLAPALVGDGLVLGDGGALAVRLQALDGAAALLGDAARFDDEGIIFSGATFIVHDQSESQIGTFVRVMLGTSVSDRLAASTGDTYLNGGSGNDLLSGADDRDMLVGGAGDDRLFGGGAADALFGGDGADVFAYLSAAESRSLQHDTLNDFTFGTDAIDLPGEGWSAVRLLSGALSVTTFDADLRQAVGGLLSARGSVLFTADVGDLRGATFLIADGNGVAGYQATEDFIIRLPDAPTALPATFLI